MTNFSLLEVKFSPSDNSICTSYAILAHISLNLENSTMKSLELGTANYIYAFNSIFIQNSLIENVSADSQLSYWRFIGAVSYLRVDNTKIIKNSFKNLFILFIVDQNSKTEFFGVEISHNDFTS